MNLLMATSLVLEKKEENENAGKKRAHMDLFVLSPFLKRVANGEKMRAVSWDKHAKEVQKKREKILKVYKWDAFADGEVENALAWSQSARQLAIQIETLDPKAITYYQEHAERCVTRRKELQDPDRYKKVARSLLEISIEQSEIELCKMHEEICAKMINEMEKPPIGFIGRNDSGRTC